MAHPGLENWSLGRLLSTAARLVEHEWNAYLAQHTLTHAGLLALHALEDGPRTQRQLAQASRVQEQTMSRTLDRLERTGYVTRQRDDADRRRVLVRRTEAGTRVFAEVQAGGVSERLVADLLGDVTRFRADLEQLVAALRDRPPRPPAR